LLLLSTALDRELGLPILADESAAHARLVPSAAIACIITLLHSCPAANARFEPERD
jgi:hypothetical protein